MTAPKMMFASACAAWDTRAAASLISNRPRSEPPAMDSSTPCAPSMDASSSGLETAISAAATARSSPRARADAHQRGAGVGHHGLDVGEVEVDQPRGGDQVGDARDALQQHLVGLLEGVEHRHVAVADRQQPVVRDHDEGVDLVAQAGDALLRLVGPAAALEGERPGDHADGQGPERSGDPGHDRRTAGAGATTLAGGHEDHVGALDDLLDLLGMVVGGLAADLGVGARAESAGELAADVELDVGVAHQECLGVGVDGDELDAFEADLDHPVDGVDSTSTNTHDLDHGQVVLRCCHGRCLSLLGCSASALRVRHRADGVYVGGEVHESDPTRTLTVK